jgi:hypothetical protein
MIKRVYFSGSASQHWRVGRDIESARQIQSGNVRKAVLGWAQLVKETVAAAPQMVSTQSKIVDGLALSHDEEQAKVARDGFKQSARSLEECADLTIGKSRKLVENTLDKTKRQIQAIEDVYSNLEGFPGKSTKKPKRTA